MSLRARGLLAMTALLLAAVSAEADRTAATYFAQRGDKAMREKDWAGAQEQYRKALDEDPDHVPAHGGLGEALLATGDRAAAVTALRKAIEVADTLQPLPAEWVAPLARVRKRLAEVDTAGVALEKLVDRYVADLLAFGERWVGRDPDAVALAVQDLARLRPTDARVKALEGKWAKAEATRWTPVFTGRDKTGWDWLDAKEWYVSQGSLVGDVGQTAMVAKTKEVYRGDYDVRMEARIVDRRDDIAGVWLLTSWKGDNTHSTFGIFNDKLIWEEEMGVKVRERRLTIVPATSTPPFDPEKWTVYEVRFRGNLVHAVVNGTVVGTVARLPDRDQGCVALKVQHATVHFRRVEVCAR